MFRLAVIGVLVLVNILIFSFTTPRDFSVSFLDVGQGDAIFIEAPGGAQMLIDGGADKSVLRELGKRMGFSDRTIDVVVATHPDADHIGGLVDVFERYEVGMVIESGVANDTAVSSALETAVNEEGVPRLLARRGMRILLGSGAYAEILYPDRDVTNSETNAGSIIMRVVYGDNAFMLTGDAPKAIEGLLVSAYGALLESDVLKAGHHGSKTSSNEYFVQAVAPKYVVYSRGCDNSYGHPATEVVGLFQRLNIPAFDTCEDGTITLHSNGRTLSVQ